ncbi:DNA repair protein RadC [Paenibacillus sp. YN15]|uniref:RadC family protein n=1 Tax=Paenibacillus sp. YN15 TaxID=1742774 RepID=UPI000DCD688A|nr:DNA repair protein RadC [Paenibacillus sp. YN15]RAV02712.1 hypothetical protein DQG13_09425 [Paenibacillus sp. YN15]
MSDNSLFKSILADTIHESANSYLIKELTDQFQSPQQLWHATEQELMKVKGIGKAKSRQIIAAVQLAKLILVPRAEQAVIRSPRDIFELMRFEIGMENKEFFYILLLDTKNKVISKELISIGSLNATIVHPREVFNAAIRQSAASILCVHNHPSGDPTPSQEDIQLTNRLAEAGKIVGIELLDHLVISGSDYVSLKEKGLI